MKFLKASLLIIAIACTAQAGEIQFGFAGHATGTELLMLLESILFSF